MDKFSELKAAIPANVKSRESVAAGFVTHNNTGGYFVIECQECGAVYPSQQADGGGQIADTGDYNDAICPHCGEESPEECENVGLVWNVQQAKIISLLAEMEAKDKRITTVTEEREFWRERVEGAEKEREEFRRRFNLERSCLEDADKRIAELEAKLATPVRLPTEHELHQVSCSECAGNCLELVESAARAAGFKVGGDE
ncbi:hypothetical protein QOM18_00665 [Serratia marcescens]|uniref:hypothetical protein n=1 Tax=Serratia marcescens TaxID=615 RepID=UPI0024C4AFD1|nr:hypothetical protein [Serratia marcescens]MDK1706823.1 hypothetical protein [Serratia marcescens]